MKYQIIIPRILNIIQDKQDYVQNLKMKFVLHKKNRRINDLLTSNHNKKID